MENDNDKLIVVRGASAGGAIIGTVIGSMLTPLAPPLGAIIGAGFGSATGAALGQAFNKNSEQSKNIKGTERNLVPSPNTLVLIINGRNKEIINKLKNQDNIIKTEDCDDLYSITQALWNGSQKDFESILFPKGFDSKSDFALLEEEEVTEYDVYFIKIELTKFIAGFSRGADQGARLSAFRTLAGKKVDISPPLLPTAYENTNVYRC